MEASTHGAFTVVCEWGNTASSMETLPSEELEGEEPLSGGGRPSRAGAVRACAAGEAPRWRS